MNLKTNKHECKITRKYCFFRLKPEENCWKRLLRLPHSLYARLRSVWHPFSPIKHHINVKKSEIWGRTWPQNWCKFDVFEVKFASQRFITDKNRFYAWFYAIYSAVDIFWGVFSCLWQRKSRKTGISRNSFKELTKNVDFQKSWYFWLFVNRRKSFSSNTPRVMHASLHMTSKLM